ncbi:MAG: hypothetical protein IJT65_03515 [Eubacterium sp.]|nr:hypothetical protein [Eubacterium sp.]
MKKIKIIPLILAMILLFSSCASAPAVKVDKTEFKTNYTYVFVHGLSGWGSYDKQNKVLKYWGTFSGDLMKYLNKQGFNCFAASVDPGGSAWDRACELYAQLTGTVVDYGKEHSERCKHERFGRDFSKEPLIEKWDSENKINLLGHSFGGATVRMLVSLMANGSEAEINATEKDDISPLFTGGKGDWIYSVTALAAPHDGTSAYNANDGTNSVDDKLSSTEKMMSDMVSASTSSDNDGRIESDYANYDLKIDNALEMNKSLKALDNVYYFSYPCSCTDKQKDGTYAPDKDITEPMFVKSAYLMGMYTGKTDGKNEITADWLENDGLVNTISARAPSVDRQKDFDQTDIPRGVWNVMPTYRGDHMSLQGGMLKRNDVREFYVKHLTMINSL